MLKTQPRRWLTVSEVVKEYEVSKSSVYRAVSARKVRAITHLGRIKIDRESIEPKIIEGVNDK